MSRYAASTTVPVEKTRAEIEAVLRRYGADQFVSGWDQERAVVGFTVHGRQVRFVLRLPDRGDPEFTITPSTRKRRSPQAALDAWEQGCRQRWRALLLTVKAKLEAVESGIAEFEDEFLAYVVLPDGSTAGEWMRPQIEHAYSTAKMPPMLAVGKGGQ